MIDTDKYEEQIEFDDVLKEIEVGVDISEGNYDILRYYRDEYKDLLAEVKRLRELKIAEEDELERLFNEGVYWSDEYALAQKEIKRLREQYTELREALVGDSPNWTHEELIEIALEYKDISTKTENGIQMLVNELEFGEWHSDMEKYSICHPDGTHCCDECLERNGFEVKK